ncbi:MAG: polysaccharide deacetylase family protein [Bacteroidales bacterium]|nr:polysaccharide deacetylase family protein [Bacteroidales bacterium]
MSKPPFICRFFTREHLICEVATEEKEIFLTFDDGPVPEITPQVLDILLERRVKATFFCVGANVARNPELFERLIGEGHAVGNHTYHHLHGWKSPPAAYVEDVTRCEPLFQTRLFRPPYGKFTPSQYFLLRNDYLFVLWSVLTRDYSRRVNPEQCLDIAIRNTRPGSIVLFHDSIKASKNMLHALPRFLDHFLEKEYTFKSNLSN